MQRADYADFVSALVACLGFYSRAVEQPEIWFSLLQAHDLGAIRQAIRLHMQDRDRGRFAPVPADLIAKIPQPTAMTANEAWAIALSASDEAATVITNNLIDQAQQACQPILDAGDKVGARMAFLAAYERAVATGVVPVWRLSLGHDPRQRAEAVERATTMGLISQTHAAGLLPPPEPTADGLAIAGLLTGRKTDADITAQNRARWRKLRDDFRASVAAQESRCEAERVARAKAFEANRQQQLNSLQAGAA